eukprot:13293298-Ditylum_brightwellii.AAC.1
MAAVMGQCSISGAPTGQQNRNGLAKIKWKNIMNMVRNWLTSNYLPKKCWYFALRAAAQASNYMPIQTEEGQWTTPFELIYKCKPDWASSRCIWPNPCTEWLRDARYTRTSFCATPSTFKNYH